MPSCPQRTPFTARLFPLFRRATLPAITGLLFDAPSAAAHVLGGPMGGFGSGFEHPLLGFDHFLAMMAVGLWGAQMGGRAVWSLPATFPLIMCIGGVVGMLSLAPAAIIAPGIALSVIVLGAVILAAWKAPEPVALVIVGFFAIFHGYPHGQIAPQAADPAAYTVGFVVATGMIHILGIGVGLLLGRLYGGRLVRGLGAFILACGAYFLLTGTT